MAKTDGPHHGKSSPGPAWPGPEGREASESLARVVRFIVEDLITDGAVVEFRRLDGEVGLYRSTEDALEAMEDAPRPMNAPDRSPARTGPGIPQSALNDRGED